MSPFQLGAVLAICSLTAALHGGAVQGTLNRHPRVQGLCGAPRDSSGCRNQPKHPSATRALENHDGGEASKEH